MCLPAVRLCWSTRVFVLKRQNKKDIYLLSLQSLRGVGEGAGGRGGLGWAFNLGYNPITRSVYRHWGLLWAKAYCRATSCCANEASSFITSGTFTPGIHLLPDFVEIIWYFGKKIYLLWVRCGDRYKDWHHFFWRLFDQHVHEQPLTLFYVAQCLHFALLVKLQALPHGK